MTALRDEILRSESGQRMLEMVSQVYDNAFVGLWLFECIGKEYDRIEALVTELEAQTQPETATWALQYWEERYGLPVGTGSLEERRAALLRKRATAKPFTPARMELLLYATFKRRAKVYENIAPFTFGAYFIDSIGDEPPIDYAKAVQAIKKAKQSHLSFEFGFQNESAINVGISTAYWSFQYPMTGTENAGVIPDANLSGGAVASGVTPVLQSEPQVFPYALCGTTNAG